MPTYAAYNARVTVTGGAIIRANSVTIVAKNDLIDVTCFDQDTIALSQGYGNYIGAVVDADITIEGHWFDDDNPFLAAGKNIVPGAILAPVTVTPTRSLPGAQWVFSRVIVESVEEMIQVRDALRVSFRARNAGKIFTYPTT